ncbi:MAG: thermonuclease family protein [Allosphingosinicella sp.]|uniref:thermonuclease family protein n=1 Tax=Allosphingosinicella sp. TaxID=2823234 RepID=UPI00394D9F4C
MILAFALSVVAAGQTFTCTPTRVWDSDGPIWCAEGPRVRLSGIAAREMDGTCRQNQPCPSASAEAARDRLARLLGTIVGRSREGHLLVRGPSLSCLSAGSGGGSRTAAWCTTRQGVDLSCVMVRSGTALRWARYDPQGRLRQCAHRG